MFYFTEIRKKEEILRELFPLLCLAPSVSVVLELIQISSNQNPTIRLIFVVMLGFKLNSFLRKLGSTCYTLILDAWLPWKGFSLLMLTGITGGWWAESALAPR